LKLKETKLVIFDLKISFKPTVNDIRQKINISIKLIILFSLKNKMNDKSDTIEKEKTNKRCIRSLFKRCFKHDNQIEVDKKEYNKTEDETKEDVIIKYPVFSDRF